MIAEPITWEDAPVTQYATENEVYKIKCVASGMPAPYVSWLRDSEHVDAGMYFATAIII